MPKVRWVMSYGFCSKFYSLSSSAILWISVKVWQSHRQLKGANFFETQCRLKWDQDFRGVATGLHSIKYRGAPLFKTRRLDKRLKIGKQKYAINVIYSRSRVVWQPGSLLWSTSFTQGQGWCDSLAVFFDQRHLLKVKGGVTAWQSSLILRLLRYGIWYKSAHCEACLQIWPANFSGFWPSEFCLRTV